MPVLGNAQLPALLPLMRLPPTLLWSPPTFRWCGIAINGGGTKTQGAQHSHRMAQSSIHFICECWRLLRAPHWLIRDGSFAPSTYQPTDTNALPERGLSSNRSLFVHNLVAS